MTILAIETATVVSGVAVATETTLLAEIIAAARYDHSETLQPHIEQALLMAGIKKNDVGAIAVSIGPGSFTGLRIGLAAAKAMAYAWQVPLVGVPTLSALAMQFPIEGANTATMMDAQKNHVYFALFRWINGAQEEILPTEVCTVEDALQKCEALRAPVTICGDAVQKRIVARGVSLPAGVMLAPYYAMMPRAAMVAMCGMQKLADGKVDNLMSLAPAYIRRSEAEVLWEKRQKVTGAVRENTD